MAGRLRSALVRRIRRRHGGEPPAIPAALDLSGLSPEDRAIIERALPHTMTGVPRLQGLVDAVRYCVRRGVPGAFAECGVWRGGSILAMILTLQQLGAEDRDIHLYDTFEGMTAPTEHDTSPIHPPALADWKEAEASGERPWAAFYGPEQFNERQVKETALATGYPAERFHFVKGPVEETLPAHAPDRLALLRLDTDWYESTRHELVHLYPRLADGGVLIVDDYGHWDGARRAVEEYFAAQGERPLLTRVDYSCRIAIKR